AVNYAIGGLDVRGYHVFNLAVHILAALTLFGVIRRTLGLSVVPEYIAAASLPLAFVAALIWTVHPLATEAVTYIIQRTELLAGLFYLLTLYCLIRGASASRSVWWNVAAVAACALGMGSKEVVVSAPLVVLVYDRLFLCRAFKEVFHRRWGLYLPLASTWALLVMLLGHGSEAAPGAVHVSVYVSRDVYWTALPTYALMQLAAIVRYLGLCFWPHPLIVDYGHLPTGTVSLNPTHAIIVLFLLAATVRAFTKQPRLAFLSLWFFAILAPSSTIIPVVGQPIAEKRMYLPLAGVVVIVVLGVYALGRRIWDRLGAPDRLRSVLGRIVGLALAGAVALTLGVVTIRRNADYHSVMSIWHDTVEKRPYNYRAWNNRGVAHGQKGNHDKAIRDYTRAIELEPNYVRAYNNRAVAYFYNGNYDKARADAKKAQVLGWKVTSTFLELLRKAPHED
ncbi:MAG: tetratricopeptide repeat protein, partial [Phycisphaerae bacterium]|nr:tetratricopeptide repeat protein [Phycisphaerae bacterium]